MGFESFNFFRQLLWFGVAFTFIISTAIDTIQISYAFQTTLLHFGWDYRTKTTLCMLFKWNTTGRLFSLCPAVGMVSLIVGNCHKLDSI